MRFLNNLESKIPGIVFGSQTGRLREIKSNDYLLNHYGSDTNILVGD